MSSTEASRELNSAAEAGAGHREISITSGILVAAMGFVMVAVVFFCVHIYTKMRWCRVASRATGSVRSARFTVGADDDPPAKPPKGLDPDVIQSLPVQTFRRGEFKWSECAVCLSEFADGEKARLLPKCNHGFHLDCIDVWFRSHSTCPLCRSSVGPHPSSNSCSEGVAPPPPAETVSIELPNLPTNVLFWGTHDEVTAGGGSPPTAAGGMQDAPSSSSSPFVPGDPKGALVINIPRRTPEDLPPSEEIKSPVGTTTVTPASTRLRSFRRLLSRGRTSGGDIEQGATEVAVE